MPLLKNLDTSVLKGASLRDITAFGNNKKMTNSKFLSQTMTSNFEHLQNFPENIPAGSDDCCKTFQKIFRRVLMTVLDMSTWPGS